jgi:hypothetical protein
MQEEKLDIFTYIFRQIFLEMGDFGLDSIPLIFNTLAACPLTASPFFSMLCNRLWGKISSMVANRR